MEKIQELELAIKDFKKRVDYSEYGGAPLLGVRGITVIGHGRSNANAIKNAIRVAAELSRARLNEKCVCPTRRVTVNERTILFAKAQS